MSPDLLYFLAFCCGIGAAFYAAAFFVATAIENLTTRKQRPAGCALEAQPVDESFDAVLRRLEQGAGMDVRALLRAQQYADMRPTADSIATYEAFKAREAKLRAKRLRREARQRFFARIKSFFTKRIS